MAELSGREGSRLLFGIKKERENVCPPPRLNGGLKYVVNVPGS